MNNPHALTQSNNNDLDHPLGRTAGRPDEPAHNLEILRAALRAFEVLDRPGEIVELPFEWTENDDWKDGVMRPRGKTGGSKASRDDRVERYDVPQYQEDADREAAEAVLAQGECVSCVRVD